MERSVFYGRVLRLSFCLLLSVLSAPAHAVFINEIHYDNISTDAGEAVELAGLAGEDLAGWTLAFYNGNGGGVYGSLELAGVFDDLGLGFGIQEFAFEDMQNGAPDGLALIDDLGGVVQFLSYEGTFTATDGPAKDSVSTNILVSESSATPVGDSLQLTGIGSVYGDFVWAAASPNTFGAINHGQTFYLPELGAPRTSVPEPDALYLLALGLLGLCLICQNRWRPGRSVPAPA